MAIQSDKFAMSGVVQHTCVYTVGKTLNKQFTVMNMRPGVHCQVTPVCVVCAGATQETETVNISSAPVRHVIMYICLAFVDGNP